MSLWKIAWRSIQQRSLASSLTALSMALGVTLVVAVLVVESIVAKSFDTKQIIGYDVIVGAKGGDLQLVLNTVFHLSSPVENIPWWYYKEFTEGSFAPYAALAIPCCMGDRYEGFRVVGTTTEMFDKLYGDPEFDLVFEFAEGRNFKQENFFEAVIGAQVARETGLKVGDTFQPSHGVDPSHVHDPFEVVGVLAPTGSPTDRALFVNIEGFYLLDDHALERESLGIVDAPLTAGEEEHAHDHGDEHGHDHDPDHGEPDSDSEAHGGDDHDDHLHNGATYTVLESHEHEPAEAELEQTGHEEHNHEAADHAHDHGHDHEHAHQHEPLPEDQREVTAILVRTSNPLMALNLPRKVNKGNVARLVHPVAEIQNLFDEFIGPTKTVLLGLSVLIVIVSGISILVSIYNSMSDRRREIAIMRALGADRRTVMLIVLLESILLSLGGGAAGWLLGHLLTAIMTPWIVAWTGISPGFLQVSSYELVLIPGLILLAALVGYLPAVVAYRTDVAKWLTATP